MVGEEEVQELLDINNLRESAGAIAALTAKANFQRAPHFFGDPIHVRRVLIAKRVQAKANSRRGHAASNLVEQLKHFITATGAQRENLAKGIQYQMARLAGV